MKGRSFGSFRQATIELRTSARSLSSLTGTDQSVTQEPVWAGWQLSPIHPSVGLPAGTSNATMRPFGRRASGWRSDPGNGLRCSGSGALSLARALSALQKFHLRNELRKTEFRLRYNCVFADTGTRDHGRFEVQVEENSADGNRTIKRRTPKRGVFQEHACGR